MTTTTETKSSLVCKAGRWYDEALGAEYRLPIRTFRVKAHDLTVHMGASPSGDQIGLPPIKPHVLGRATISNYHLSAVRFMTDPARETRDFSLSIHPSEPRGKEGEPTEGTWSMLRGLDESGEGPYPDYLQRALKTAPATAFLGFLAKDWELDLKDDWYLQIYISTENLAKLIDAVRQSKAHDVTLALRFLNLYVTASDFHAPPAAWVNWYLAPSNLSPEDPNAVGYVTGLTWGETPERTPVSVSAETDEAPLGPALERNSNAHENEHPVALDYVAIAAKHQANVSQASQRIARSLNWLIVLLAVVIAILVIHR